MSRRKSASPGTTVVVVQDKSGSMSSRRQATVTGYNEYLSELKKKAEGKVKVTLIQFDTEVDTMYSAVPLSEVSEMRDGDYIIGGMTALYDAVGRAVRATEKAVSKNETVLVVIMTDGGENSSTEWISHQPNEDRAKPIMDLMKEKRSAGWEFIFLGAGEEAWNTGKNLGFTYNQVINYGTDAASAQEAYRGIAMASVNVTRGAMGATGPNGQALTASSYLSTSDIKMNLENKSGFAFTDEAKKAKATSKS